MHTATREKTMMGKKEQYRLSESDRQKIIEQSPLEKQMAEIERQRLAFIEKNGDDGTLCFG